jgi:hypothetical protein
MNGQPRPIKYRKGLKVDSRDWEIMRDLYSLVDPAHEIPKTPRFAFSRSNAPFLVLRDRFGKRALKAGIERTENGQKFWWLQWERNGKEQMHVCLESLPELLLYLEDALDRRRREVRRNQPKKSVGKGK